MKVRCEYCNNLIDDGDEKCPGCGAVNNNYNRSGVGVPTTIAELEQWYKDRGLPPYETTRFFIGIDYKEPRAFGIYKDTNTGKFVVYKNKGNGERAIRYEGTDEKYAVNELYLKLKEEIALRKNGKVTNKKQNNILAILIFVFFFGIVFFGAFFSTKSGYYHIDDNYYYNHDGSWYIYYNNDWNSTSKPYYDGDLDDYYEGDYYSDNSNYSDIRDSSVYDSSWDSDSDWDSDSSWDSSGSDWDSDW